MAIPRSKPATFVEFDQRALAPSRGRRQGHPKHSVSPKSHKAEGRASLWEEPRTGTRRQDTMTEKELKSREEEKGGWNGKESEGLKQGQAIKAKAATSLAQ